MSRLPVSIVGAGISGLVLGQCLLARGIPAVVFEKGRFSASKNSHGITLYSHIYRPLLKILHLEETSFKQKVAVDAAVGGEGRLPSSSSDSGSCFRANRGRFEQLLAEGLQIEWEHQVASVTLAPSPGAAASLSLKSGDQVPSSVIVGADGPHSSIRRAITMASTDAAALKVLPFATYNGKRHLTPQQFNASFAEFMQDSTVLEQQISDVFLQISLSDRTHEAAVVSYTYSRPARDGEDKLYRPKRTKGEAHDIPEELLTEIDALKHQLQGPFRVIFERETIRKDRLLNWLMRCIPQPLEPGKLDSAARGGVVLLGDAVHAEPILYGQGANMAIEDGMRLADMLTQSMGPNLSELYDSRSQAWSDSVLESEKRLAELHGTLRPCL